MALGILAKKLHMAELFNEHGRAVAVTVLETGPCTITQVKGRKTDGYEAIQVAFQATEEKKLNKPQLGHLKKAGVGPFRVLREFRLEQPGEYTVGQQLTASAVFKEGELVDVSGTSIGKGFQGGVKRWHWKGGGATHGSMSHRAPGSIGSTTTPGRVLRGHHLPGHMGDEKVTIQNLRIMKIDDEANRLIVQGAVPGAENALLVVHKSVKRPGVVVAAKGLQEIVAGEEEDAKKKPAKPAAKKK